MMDPPPEPAGDDVIPAVVGGNPSGPFARRSISFVTSGEAGAPLAMLNLMPLYSAGLWLAVKLIPPAAFSRIIWKDTTGVGTGSFERRTGMPYDETISAVILANSGLRKRVS